MLAEPSRLEVCGPEPAPLKTIKNTVLMGQEEQSHVPRWAVPDITWLEPGPWLTEMTTTGLAYFLPTGQHTPKSLNAETQVATGGRTR